MKPQEILGEVLSGYSLIGDAPFFFKHPSVADRANVGKIEIELEKRGRNMNFFTKEEMIQRAIDRGVWSDEKEEDIKMLKWEIKAKKRNLEKLAEPSLKNELGGSIKRLEEELSCLLKKRSELDRLSLEDYVASKLPMFLCSREVYEDSSFSKKIPEDVVRSIIVPYLDINNKLSNMDSLLKAVFLPSFFDLLFIYKSHDLIFGKNIYELTVFQKDLLGYGKVLHSKFSRFTDIPEAVKNDPIKLYAYDEDKKGAKEIVETSSLRGMVSEKGGLENMTAKDKLT